ncbi:unnamed protein product [Blepharisma stoltei]|uniref:Uncharacterized protein n=1 Tax=Blepharisma stoltei TaxID=1481888 RepID=A0AAU9K9S5_9CILI|nr:unnamed protein product [Blepharisma stoltei]
MTKIINHGRWSESEHEKYREGLKRSLDWKKIAKLVETRTIQQCRSHHQKMKKQPAEKIFKGCRKAVRDAETQYELENPYQAYQPCQIDLNFAESFYKSFWYLYENSVSQQMYFRDALPKECAL